MRAVGKVFCMDSPQRLLLRALLIGMGDAVRRNDESAGDRYHRRLRGIAPHFDTNPRVSDAPERLVLIEPFETREQALEAEQRAIREEFPKCNSVHNDRDPVREMVRAAGNHDHQRDTQAAPGSSGVPN
jgi:hypothetical protein